MKLINLIKPLCPQCPYTLGQVEFIDNPCSNCKANNYKMYHMLMRDRYRLQGSVKSVMSFMKS